jgi:TonB family protein
MAALFFALGATVGRGTIDRWVAYVQDWGRSQITSAPAPRVTPPAPPQEPAVEAVETTENNKESKAAVGKDAAKTDASSSAAKNPSDTKEEVARTDKTEVAMSGSAPNGGSATASTAHSAMPPALTERGPQHSAESPAPRKSREMEMEPSRMAMGRSILVNAPEPGSQPFVVNLPGEAVSASAGIAISARRTLEVQPRSSAAASGSERVIIGSLVSHSEPFYPAEARKQRIEGSVELRARVGRTGEVIGVTPVSGPGLLSAAAVTAVREWRYAPTYINGDPVETLADVTIVFRLP